MLMAPQQSTNDQPRSAPGSLAGSAAGVKGSSVRVGPVA